MTTIQVRRDTASDWTAVNPVLGSGELGYETDTGKFKIGDGATAWSGLIYQGTAGAAGVSSFQGRSGSVTLTKSDVTGTGLAASDVSNVVAATNNGSEFVDKGTVRYNLHESGLVAKLVAVANQPLTGLLTIDSVALTNGDVVLLTNQTTASQNGLWRMPATGSGAWSRPTDFPSGGSVQSRQVTVGAGTNYAGSIWTLQTPGSVTIDTDPQVWDMPNVLTQSPGDNSKSPASTEFVAQAIAAYDLTQVEKFDGGSAGLASAPSFIPVKNFTANVTVNNCILQGAPTGTALTIVLQKNTNLGTPSWSTVQSLTIAAGSTTPVQGNPAATITGPCQLRLNPTSLGGATPWFFESWLTT